MIQSRVCIHRVDYKCTVEPHLTIFLCKYKSHQTVQVQCTTGSTCIYCTCTGRTGTCNLYYTPSQYTSTCWKFQKENCVPRVLVLLYYLVALSNSAGYRSNPVLEHKYYVVWCDTPATISVPGRIHAQTILATQLQRTRWLVSVHKSNTCTTRHRSHRLASIIVVVMTIHAFVMELSVLGLLLCILATPSNGFGILPYQNVGVGAVVGTTRVGGHCFGASQSRLPVCMSNSKWDDLVDEDEVSMSVCVQTVLMACLFFRRQVRQDRTNASTFPSPSPWHLIFSPLIGLYSVCIACVYIYWS